MKTRSVPPSRLLFPFAHSQPKDPRLLPMPGRQRYRRVNRFIKRTAAPLRGRSCARRPACLRSGRQERPGRRRNLFEWPKPNRTGKFLAVSSPPTAKRILSFRSLFRKAPPQAGPKPTLLTSASRHAELAALASEKSHLRRQQRGELAPTLNGNPRILPRFSIFVDFFFL